MKENTQEGKCSNIISLRICPAFSFSPVIRQVIELVLRAEEGLHRDVVRHLAQVEEKVLESLAWTGDSPLWEELRANEGPLPSCQQVGNKTHKITSVTYSRFPSR